MLAKNWSRYECFVGFSNQYGLQKITKIQRLFSLIYGSEQQSLREGSLHPQEEEEAAGEQILRITL